MPYHLLYETQAAKDRLLAHRIQATCMAPIPLLQHHDRTSTESLLDTTPTPPPTSSPTPEQLPPPQDAYITSSAPLLSPTLPQRRGTAAENNLLPPVKESHLTSSGPFARTPTPLDTGPRAFFTTTSPLLLLLILIIIIILLIILELRFLEAHASLFDRIDNWFRRFHKGTSKFRHKNPQPIQVGLPASDLEDVDTLKRKARRKRGGLRAPGFAVKSLLVWMGKGLQRAMKRVIEGPEGREIVVRSFDGQPVAPMVTRPWELPLAPLAPMTPAPMSGGQAPWVVGAAAPRIAYGVPPALKPARARRTTLTFNTLEPEAAVAGEGLAPVTKITSILRQQAIADDEARGTVDPLLMRAPRGDDGWEERDLEALQGREVSGRGGGRGGEGLVGRRGWGGGCGDGDGDGEGEGEIV